MQRYFIQLAYNGTKFHGWQIQPNAITVQEVLTHGISTLLKEKVEVVGAGRTDTGVHASFFVAHFEVENELDDCFQFGYKLNSFLKADISIVKIFPVLPEMHARFSALSRTYRYYLSNVKQPFRQEFTAFYPHQLDVSLMNEAAKQLFGYTDFTSFSKLHTDVKTNNCKITKAEWLLENGVLVFEVQADRFLRNMVRAIVGTLLEVGKHKLSIEGFKKIIEQKDRGVAGASVLARGLFLTDISYPEEVDKQFSRENTHVCR